MKIARKKKRCLVYYAIEFRSGTIEFEYQINARNRKILKYDVDLHDLDPDD